MTRQFARPAMQLATALVLVLGVSACQTVSDLDPTGLLGGDDTAPLPADAPPVASSDSNVTTPSLAALPPRPEAPSASEQAQTAQQVASAGAQAQYSAQALRAGTEPAAPPPPSASGSVAPPTAGMAPVTQASLAPPTAEAPPTAGAPPTAEAQPMEQADLNMPPTAEPPPPTVRTAPPTASLPAASPAVVASAAPEPAPAPAAAPSAVRPPMAAPAASAAGNNIAPPPGAEPAVPAVPGGAGVRLAANPTSAQLGFHASSAPPLNAEVAQWVPGPILNHYRRAAAVAGVAGASTGAPGTPASMIAAMNGGVAPAEIIYFPDNTASLSAKARGQVREAAEAFKAHGGTGSVRVVGHASSRTANMPLQQHMDVIFRMSQQRANAVAQALIQAGVPAAKVQVEAVGDSQPVYYESMPKGEAGNRRAEIFLAG